MQFNEVKEEVKVVPFEELRTDCDNYFEGVVIKQELSKLVSRLKNFFGEPVFPSKNRLSFQAQETVKNFGGIQAGQTLYFWNEGSAAVCAMLWPWQDGEHTTLKIIKK